MSDIGGPLCAWHDTRFASTDSPLSPIAPSLTVVTIGSGCAATTMSLCVRYVWFSGAAVYGIQDDTTSCVTSSAARSSLSTFFAARLCARLAAITASCATRSATEAAAPWCRKPSPRASPYTSSPSSPYASSLPSILLCRRVARSSGRSEQGVPTALTIEAHFARDQLTTKPSQRGIGNAAKNVRCSAPACVSLSAAARRAPSTYSHSHATGAAA